MKKERKGIGKKVLIILLMLALVLPVGVVPAHAEEEETKLVAITFDDGPSRFTGTLLDGLKERGAHATFFMTGKNGSSGITNYKDLLQRMWEEGHQLANHTYRHATLTKCTVEEIQEQVSSVNELIFDEVGGSYTVMLRPPGGSKNDTVLQTVEMPVVTWSVDTEDWKYRDEEHVYNEVVTGAFDGAIILLHDLYETSVKGALRAIDTLKEEGYEFVTVSELLRRKGVTPENGKVYYKAAKGEASEPYEAPVLEAVEDKLAGIRKAVFSAEDGLTIYYTTDGSYPDLGDLVYSEPLTVTEDTVFTVIGVDKYGTRTPVSTLEVEAAVLPAVPLVGYGSGVLTLTPVTEGSTIVYTLDGTEPTSESALYTEPVSVAEGTIKYAAVNNAGYMSEVVTCTVTAYGQMYLDMPSEAWYYSYAAEALGLGLMEPSSAYRFNAEGEVTRAALMECLFLASGSPEVPEDAPTFLDVPADNPYYDAVRWAAAVGITSGTDDGKFSPEDPLMREQMALMLYRLASVLDLDMENEGQRPQDYGDVSDYAAEAVSWAMEKGLLLAEGGLVSPKQPVTRADCAVALVGLTRLSPAKGDEDRTEVSTGGQPGSSDTADGGQGKTLLFPFLLLMGLGLIRTLPVSSRRRG